MRLVSVIVCFSPAIWCCLGLQSRWRIGLDLKELWFVLMYNEIIGGQRVDRMFKRVIIMIGHGILVV